MSDHAQRLSVNQSPLFESQNGWSPAYALAKGEGPGVVVGPGANNPNVITQDITVRPGQQLHVTARASSVGSNEGNAVIQINWLDAGSNFVTVSYEKFPVTKAETTFTRTVVVPSKAVYGRLYVVPGGPNDVIRYTEMRVTRLEPINDFFAYKFYGYTGAKIVSGLALLIALVLVFMVLKRAGLVTLNRSIVAAKHLFPLFAIAALIAILFLLQGAYEQHYDSQYHQGIAEIVMKWSEPSLHFGGNPMRWFGIQPLVKPYLSATFLIGRLVDPDIRIPVQAAFQAVLMLLIGSAICWRGGARMPQAFAISLIAMMFCWVPMLSREAISLNATLGLYWQEASLATILSLLLFCLIGTGSIWTSLICTTALGVTILWVLLAFPYIVVYFALATSLLCLGATLAIESRRELLHKIAASTIILSMLIGIGSISYLRNIFDYTPQLFYQTTFGYDYTSLLFSSHIVGGVTVYVFFGLAVVGIIGTLCAGNRFARKVVLAGVVFELGILAATILNARFRLLPIAFTYVELTGIAVVALFAGAGIWSILVLLGWSVDWTLRRAWIHRQHLPPLAAFSGFRGRPGAQWLSARAIFPFAGAIFFVAFIIRSYLLTPAYYFPGWPPRVDSAPAQLQLKELGLQPGDVFRGRSVTLLEMTTPRPIQWGPHFFPVLYFKYRKTLGNDLMNDPQALGVPVSNEYGHFVSPPMLALLAAAFYNPVDRISRAAQTLRVYRPNLARLLGVAVVVSDAPLSGETRLYEGEADGHPLYIHKVTGTNVGQFSPTRVVVVRSAAEVFDLLQSADFDGRKTAVVERPVQASLVEADEVAVRVKKGPSMEVSAKSPSTSLLVLPFEWSNCLHARGRGFVEMLPVDLALVGLVIQGDAHIELEYRYGLFADTSCRRKDLERATGLDLANAALGRLFFDHREMQ